MALSTNSVFHFTDSFDTVKSIISSYFRIKYCLETIESNDRIIRYAVPMDSFCDIPLSQVIGHIEKYGGYGLGLNKSWAKRKGLNPVLYLEKKSIILNEVLIRAKFEDGYNDVVQEFLRYTKNYEGKLYRKGELVQKVYRYYDEREWRYCPKEKDLGINNKIIHNTDHYTENKAAINAEISALKLEFSLKDISYIILKDEKEIVEMIEYLEINLMTEKNKNEIKVLTSKIITSKQIKSDF